MDYNMPTDDKGGVLVRSEIEIRKERDIAKELITRIKKRLTEESNNYGFNEVKDITKVIDPLIVFVFGFFCFIVSYKFSIFGATRRIYWSIQQRLLNFGLLSLIFGLVIFFNIQLPQVNLLIGTMAFIVIIFHLKEYHSDYNYYTKMKHKKSES